MCAELLPEMISLDEWGYPIVDARALPPDLHELAERAVDACPTFALLLERRRLPAAAAAAQRRERPASGVRAVRRVPRRADEARRS